MRTARTPTALCAGKKPRSGLWEQAEAGEEADAVLALQQGGFLARNADWNGAIREYSLALRRNPPRPLQAQLYQARGEAYLHKARLRAGFFGVPTLHAVRDFRRVIALRPEQAEGFLWRARARLAGFQLWRALPDFNTAVEIANAAGDDQLLAVAYRERGALHERLQNRQAALADYCQSLRREPVPFGPFAHTQTLENVRRVLAMCLAYGEWDVTIAACDQLLLLPPEVGVASEVRVIQTDAQRRQAAIRETGDGGATVGIPHRDKTQDEDQ